jgi:type I restriction enzyme, S subunit
MPRGSTVLDSWTHNGPSTQTGVVARGDILFGKLRPYFRKVGVAPVDGRCSTEILVLKPTSQEYYGVLLGHVASQRFIDHCVAVSRGTRMPRSEWNDAATYELAVPPSDVAAEHAALATAAYSKIRTLVHEARSLQDLRATVLPRLVSGRVRVSDVNSAASEAVRSRHAA